jgi:hypothetical protein
MTLIPIVYGVAAVIVVVIAVAVAVAVDKDASQFETPNTACL